MMRPRARVTRRQAMMLGIVGSMCAAGAMVDTAAAKDHGVRGLIPGWGRMRRVSVAGPYLTAAEPHKRQTARDMAMLVRSILQNSGYALSGDADDNAVEFDTVPRFSAWRSVADLLVVGRLVELPTGRLQVEFRVWDVGSGTQLVGKRLSASAEQWQRLAYAIAADIYECLDDD